MANIFNEYFINIANDLPIPEQSQYGLNFTDHPSIRGINYFMSKHHSYGFTFKPSNPTIINSNGLSVNHDKFLTMWLGNFSLVHSMKLLGVTIDKDLNFTEHVADIVRRVSNQIQVMQRHKKLINTDTKTKLYNAYLLPHLYYCCVVWHHCGQRNLKKLEKINKRSLRFVFNDNDSNYMQLLNRVGQPSLFNGRVHYILTLVYKSLNGLAPEYITNMFSLKTHNINLRTSGTHSLFIPRVNTTKYGLHSLSYYGSKLWNSLPNTTRGLFLESPENFSGPKSHL